MCGTIKLVVCIQYNSQLKHQIHQSKELGQFHHSCLFLTLVKFQVAKLGVSSIIAFAFLCYHLRHFPKWLALFDVTAMYFKILGCLTSNIIVPTGNYQKTEEWLKKN